MPSKRYACVNWAILAAALLLLGAAVGAGGRHAAGGHAGRVTFAYGIYAYDFASLKAFAGFRQSPGGRLVPLRLWANSNGAPDLPQALTPSPDGEFLYVACGTDAEYPTAHTYFIQYRVLPTGELREVCRFGLGDAGNRRGLGDAADLVFPRSGRCAYALGGAEHGPGAVLQLHVGLADHPVWPPAATAPCGPNRYGLVASDNGRNLYVLDGGEGRLWQYALTAQGEPIPLRPPWLPVSPMLVRLTATPGGVCAADAHALYHFRARPGGTLTPLSSFPLAPGEFFADVAPLGRGVLAVLSRRRLLVLRAGPGGALVRAGALPLAGGSLCRVDPTGRFLYVQGLLTRIHVFRIRPGGGLLPVRGPLVQTGAGLTGLVFVRR